MSSGDHAHYQITSYERGRPVVYRSKVRILLQSVLFSLLTFSNIQLIKTMLLQMLFVIKSRYLPLPPRLVNSRYFKKVQKTRTRDFGTK